jgi:hypothetical protein
MLTFIHRQLAALTLFTLLCAMFSIPVQAITEPDTEALGTYLQLPPGERYRQLTFLLFITDQVDPALLELLSRHRGVATEAPASVTDIETYQGAGFRIASSQTILDGIVDLVRFRQLTEPLILKELTDIELEYPALTRMVNQAELAEEAILVRSAVADSVEALFSEEEYGTRALLNDYREQTLRVRNDLEFMHFAHEMDLLTAQSIEETSGRLEAFHRMVDDGYDIEFLRERIEATELMNEELSNEHRMYALMRTTRLLMMMLPVINRYYYYR